MTTSTLELVMSPSTRSLGRSPAVMCRSDALRSIISSSSTRRLRDWEAGAWVGVVIRGTRYWVLGPGGYENDERMTRCGTILAYENQSTSASTNRELP